MGKVVRCPECSKAYRDLQALEELRENDGICLSCNAPVEVADWDRVLASWKEDEADLDDIEDPGLDEDDWEVADDEADEDDTLDGGLASPDEG